MKPYTLYKDSGVKWIGDIPSSWEKSKLKYISLLYTGNSLNDSQKSMYDSDNQNGIPYISSKDIDVDYHTVNYDNGLRIPPENNPLKVSPRGSFLLCVEGGSAGKKIAFLDRDVCFVNKLCCFDSTRENKFQYYFVQSSNFQDKFKLSLTGLIGGVSISTLREFEITLPPLSEQKQIVKFLDYKTQKIDDHIEKTEKKIELLKEKRVALINHCVTKGLQPDVEMKDSGVEWIGEIPSAWVVCQIKQYIENITDGAHISPDTSEESYPFISTVDIGNGVIDFVNCLKTSTESYSILSKQGCQPKIGDVLFSKDGTVGRTMLIDCEKEFVVASSLIILTPKQNQLDSKYLNYILQSSYILTQINSFTKGSALKRVSLTNLKKVRSFFPLLDEQQKIVEYLDKNIQKVDARIEKETRRIELLKESRQSLISEVVTGKLDVRSWKK